MIYIVQTGVVQLPTVDTLEVQPPFLNRLVWEYKPFFCWGKVLYQPKGNTKSLLVATTSRVYMEPVDAGFLAGIWSMTTISMARVPGKFCTAARQPLAKLRRFFFFSLLGCPWKVVKGLHPQYTPFISGL